MDKYYMKWIMLLSVPLLLGCGTVRYVPVETVSREQNTVEVHDTVEIVREVLTSERRSLTDSVKVQVTSNTVITLNEAGDTIKSVTEKETFIGHTTRELEEYYASKLDSIGRVNIRLQEAVRELSEQKPLLVEKSLTLWQTFRLTAFWWLVGALGLLGAWHWRGQLLRIVRMFI